MDNYSATSPGISLKSNQSTPMKTEYGRFLNDFSYELADPNTPRPWMNLLSNENYILSISQLGSGYSVYKSIESNRVTQYANSFDNLAGRFFYIREEKTGDVFSPTVYPVHQNLEKYSDYSCIYRPGSMFWKLKYGGIVSNLSTIVCQDDDTELYMLELTNNSGNDTVLDCFLYLEWEFGGAPQEWGFAINTFFDRAANSHVADVSLPPEYRCHQTGFITSSEPIVDFDSRSRAFLGPMGTISKPHAVINGQCTNSGAPIIGKTCGAVQVRIEIPVGQTKQVVFAVGIIENVSKLPDTKKYHDVSCFEDNMQKIDRFWKQILNKQKIHEPADILNRFCDTWMKYQVIQNARWTRWASQKGYRDVLQDAAGTRLLDPERSYRMITEAIIHQRSDGYAPREWSITPWRDNNWKDYRDSCFWLIYAIDAYFRETGDIEFLRKKLPFIDSNIAVEVWDHMNLAVDYLWEHRGDHGLCLIGQGDWLDSLNQAGIKGKGESVWLSQALCWALLKMKEMAAILGINDSVGQYQERYEFLKEKINTFGWDGEWFLMGYNDEGDKIGSDSCPDGGKIFLNPQVWAVISHTASTRKIESSFTAISKYLATEVGPLLFSPKYSKYNSSIGRLSIGASEVDSVYVHAATFKILSDYILGKGDEGYDAIRQIVPALRILPAEQTGAEPFCCVNAFAGPSWSRPGWSYVGWWSATCDWLMQIVVENLFGLRAEYSGLRVDPCLPSGWERARMTRYFRNAWYDVTITKQKGICKGKVSLELDGCKMQGNLLPVLGDKSHHVVKCTII